MPKFRPTDLEIAYMAGYFDGEGCVNIHKNSNRVSFTARLMVGSVELSALLMFSHFYGGSIQKAKSRTKNSRDSWMWYATGKSLESCLIDLMPHLQIKLLQAETAMELWHSMSKHAHITKGVKGAHAVPQDILDYRAGLKFKVNELNRVGKRKEG